MAKKPMALTHTKRSILKLPQDELRRLAEKLKRGLSLKGAYYVPKGTKVTKRTAYVTVSRWRDFQLGISHGRAAMRRKGHLGYGPRGEERAIPKSVGTRNRLAEPQYSSPHQHPYQNTDGDIVYDFFWKKGLRHMQDYRDAYNRALHTGDGLELKEFKYRVIITYDGPDFPHYRNKGVRVYPETNLSKLNKYMPEPKLIIGHNLPFDLGAISNRTVKSRDPKFYGALSIGMCRCFERPAEEQIYGGTDADEEYRACGYHPNIRIKKLGLGKHLMKCGTKFDGFGSGKAKYFPPGPARAPFLRMEPPHGTPSPKCRDHGPGSQIPPDTRLAGRTLSRKSEFTRDRKSELDFNALIRGGTG